MKRAVYSKVIIAVLIVSFIFNALLFGVAAGSNKHNVFNFGDCGYSNFFGVLFVGYSIVNAIWLCVACCCRYDPQCILWSTFSAISILFTLILIFMYLLLLFATDCIFTDLYLLNFMMSFIYLLIAFHALKYLQSQLFSSLSSVSDSPYIQMPIFYEYFGYIACFNALSLFILIHFNVNTNYNQMLNVLLILIMIGILVFHIIHFCVLHQSIYQNLYQSSMTAKWLVFGDNNEDGEDDCISFKMQSKQQIIDRTYTLIHYLFHSDSLRIEQTEEYHPLSEDDNISPHSHDDQQCIKHVLNYINLDSHCLQLQHIKNMPKMVSPSHGSYTNCVPKVLSKWTFRVYTIYNLMAFLFIFVWFTTYLEAMHHLNVIVIILYVISFIIMMYISFTILIIEHYCFDLPVYTLSDLDSNSMLIHQMTAQYHSLQHLRATYHAVLHIEELLDIQLVDIPHARFDHIALIICMFCGYTQEPQHYDV